ncbi:sodium:proton antiporter [Halorubellus sp. PRR65]|uniref:cation:proton antiporter n=1 Tax=Halorubellus sp. PRR65 TaxID=3098148 RepID=UPI002B25F795|nr:sodium:proton antiporter [Halorubellus sp. PRR65]
MTAGALAAAGVDVALAASAGDGIEASLIDLVAVFVIAGGVGVFVSKVGHFPYTIALLVAGFAVSVASSVAVGPNEILGEIVLTHDVILLVLLPPLLFEGAATTDVEEFESNLPIILLLAIVGLVASIAFVGVAAHWLFTGLGLVSGDEFTLLVSLLFATTVLPTDPVSVLALFEEIGVPERLSVLVEGESLINDGVAVVIFTTLYALLENERSLEYLLAPENFGAVLVELVYTSLGGAVVGFVAGYAVYSVMRDLDEHMTEIVLTIILAYGSFLLAEHYLHVSGVIATVVAGLLIGNRGAEYAMSAQTKLSVFNTWETGAFIVNTFIFVVIGAKTPVTDIVGNAELLVPAIGIVLVGRALAVYPLTTAANRFVRNDVDLRNQHVLVWGGLHGSIPIALVLGVQESVVPFAPQLRVLVFGVAAFSLIGQGLTMKPLIERLGIVTTTEEDELYQLLVGRARAVDAALEAAERLHDRGRIPDSVFEQFQTEYRVEKDDLNRAIGRLLAEHPDIRDRERLVGERQVLKREQSALKDAELSGVISTEIADALLEEVNIKLDRVQSGESTVTRDRDEEGYREFWRERASDHGLLDADLDGEDGDTDRGTGAE